MNDDKVRENRFRRMLDRRGYRLEKSRRRDPRAYDYGGYMIIDHQVGGCVAGGNPLAFSLTLDDVEAWIEEDREPIKPAPKSKQKAKAKLDLVRSEHRGRAR